MPADKWRLERVPPPEQYKLPATDEYRLNYERIFGGNPDCEHDIQTYANGDTYCRRCCQLWFAEGREL